MSSTYTVKRGDTLGEIAEKLNSTVNLITSTNQIADPNKISIGQKIVSPELPEIVYEFTDEEMSEGLIGFEGDGNFVSYLDKAPERVGKKAVLTVGYGHRVVSGDLDMNGVPITREDQPITKEQAEEWYKQDTALAIKQAKTIPGFEKMSLNRQKAMVNLTYNMGFGWTTEFKNAYSHIVSAASLTDPDEINDAFFKAAEEIRFKDATLPYEQRIPSDYSVQVGDRSVTVSD